MAELKSITKVAQEIRKRGQRIRGIFATDRDSVIGYDNDLIFHNPKDLEHFKKTTTSHIVIMGRKTLASMNDKPLPNRLNVVFTRVPNKRLEEYRRDHDGHCPENLKFIGAPMQLLDIQERPDQKYYVIGGSGIFKAFMYAVDTWIVTEYDIKVREPMPNPHFQIDPDRLTPIRSFEHYSVGVEAGLIPEGYLEPKFRYFPDIARVRRTFQPSMMETDTFISPTGMEIKYRIMGYSRVGAPRKVDREKQRDRFMELYNSTKIHPENL